LAHPQEERLARNLRLLEEAYALSQPATHGGLQELQQDRQSTDLEGGEGCAGGSSSVAAAACVETRVPDDVREAATGRLCRLGGGGGIGSARSNSSAMVHLRRLPSQPQASLRPHTQLAVAGTAGAQATGAVASNCRAHGMEGEVQLKGAAQQQPALPGGTLSSCSRPCSGSSSGSCSMHSTAGNCSGDCCASSSAQAQVWEKALLCLNRNMCTRVCGLTLGFLPV